MKKTFAVAALALATWSGSSMSAGLGMSIQSGDPTIYVPFDINDKVRLEPFLNYVHDKTETSAFGPGSPYTVKAIDETTTYRLGVGVFGLASVGESVRAYFGGRLSYISGESKLSYDGGTRPPGFPLTASKDDFDGYSLEPTIGLEYRFTERFSIGGEAALIIGEIDGDDMSDETVRTDTNVVVRYRF